MRALVVAIAASSLATSAAADVTKLGGFSIGQDLGKAKTAKATVFGCAGELRPELGRGRVTRVRFEGVKCKRDAVVAAITKAAGKAAIVNAAGDQLWEGSKAAVMVSSREGSRLVIQLVPAGAGSKRTCWPDDGFAGFWTSFKSAKGLVSSFVLPLKDGSGEVVAADAAALTTWWTSTADAADLKQLANGQLTATCEAGTERYELSMPDSYVELVATKSKDGWRWTTVHLHSPD